MIGGILVSLFSQNWPGILSLQWNPIHNAVTCITIQWLFYQMMTRHWINCNHQNTQAAKPETRTSVTEALIQWSQTRPRLIPDRQSRPRWVRSLCGWRGGWDCSWTLRLWESCWSWASPNLWQAPFSLPRPSGTACCPAKDGFCKCCPAADIGVVTVQLENLFP